MTDSTPILFFSPGACSFGAIAVFDKSGIAYKLCALTRDERQTDAFKKINPLGQVSTLTVGNRMLTENAAVLQYIANQAPDKNLGFKQGTEEFDNMNQLLSYLSSNYHTAYYPYFAPQRYIDDEKAQEAVKQKAIANIKTKFEFLNKRLGGKEYFFNKPTIADYYFYGMARWGTPFVNFAADYQNIAKFQAAMEKDPAIQFALLAEKQDAAAKSGGKFQGFVKLNEVQAPSAAKAA